MSRATQSIDLRGQAQRRRALAPAYDPVRRDFELALADRMEQEAADLLVPPEPLQKGLGGEIIPAVADGLPGLESTLKEPDLVNAEASRQRANLLERAGALELGIETAEQVHAANTIERMVAHQLAAGHRRALELLAESATSKDPEIAIKKARASARLMDAFSRSALTLQRLQGGGNQVIEVQHINIVGQAVIGQAGGGVEKPQNHPNGALMNRGGRPPTSGDRTARAIEERLADRQLLSRIKQIQDIA